MAETYTVDAPPGGFRIGMVSEFPPNEWVWCSLARDLLPDYASGQEASTEEEAQAAAEALAEMNRFMMLAWPDCEEAPC